MHPFAELYVRVFVLHRSLAMHIFLSSLLGGYQKPRKKKQKWQNRAEPMYYFCPSFSAKKQNGRTHVPVSGVASVLFCFFFVFSNLLQSAGRESIKNLEKKTNKQKPCPSIWHGVSMFAFAFSLFCVHCCQETVYSQSFWWFIALVCVVAFPWSTYILEDFEEQTSIVLSESKQDEGPECSSEPGSEHQCPHIRTEAVNMYLGLLNLKGQRLSEETITMIGLQLGLHICDAQWCPPSGAVRY